MEKRPLKTVNKLLPSELTLEEVTKHFNEFHKIPGMIKDTVRLDIIIEYGVSYIGLEGERPVTDIEWETHKQIQNKNKEYRRKRYEQLKKEFEEI